MHLDIVVPLLDEHTALPALLEHLHTLVDEDRRARVLLVDGGSDDGSRELLQGCGLSWVGAPSGRAAQMNVGARATDGEVLLFLHADTILPPGALDAVRDAVGSGRVGGFFRLRLDSERPLLRLVGRAISARSRLTGIATGDQAIFVTREAFSRLGGYAPLPLFEDVDLCSRLRRVGPLAPVPLTVVTSARRWESHGPWRTVIRMWLLRLAYSLGIAPRHLARYYEAVR